MTNQIDMIIKGLNAYRRVYPAQKHNIEAIKKFIAPMSYKDKHQNILNSQRNVLYAIGGRAGLTNFQDYVKILKAEKKKNPNVLAMPFHWNAQLMAGSTSHAPTSATKSTSARPPASMNKSGPQAQLAQYTFCEQAAFEPEYHEIMVEVRFPDYSGGDGRVLRRFPAIHDTGSTVQSLKRSDWNLLNVHGIPANPGITLTAGGVTNSETIIMEVRIVKPVIQLNAQRQPVHTGAYEPMTIWFVETLRIVEDTDCILTGATMRQFLYFAIPPGNGRLLISQCKQAIIDRLPVVKPPLP